MIYISSLWFSSVSVETLKKVTSFEQSVTLKQINSRAAAPWVDKHCLLHATDDLFEPRQRWTKFRCFFHNFRFPWLKRESCTGLALVDMLLFGVQRGNNSSCHYHDFLGVLLDHICLWSWKYIFCSDDDMILVSVNRISFFSWFPHENGSILSVPFE